MKVLILGDGLFGNELHNQTEWDFISRKKDKIDINYFNEWSDKLNSYDVIVNAIAYTKTYEDNYEDNWNANVKFLNELINFCNVFDKKLVHISTDYLYAGSVTNAKETDVPVHVNSWYGYTKLVGDAIVQLNSKNFLLCRLSHKPYPFPYEYAWYNVKTNCDYVNTICELVIELIHSNAAGLYNVGTEHKTIYDLAKKTNESIKTSKANDYVPNDTTMNITKLQTKLTS